MPDLQTPDYVDAFQVFDILGPCCRRDNYRRLDDIDTGRWPKETLHDGYVVTASCTLPTGGRGNGAWIPFSLEWRSRTTTRTRRVPERSEGRVVIKSELLPDGAGLIVPDERTGDYQDHVTARDG